MPVCRACPLWAGSLVSLSVWLSLLSRSRAVAGVSCGCCPSGLSGLWFWGCPSPCCCLRGWLSCSVPWVGRVWLSPLWLWCGCGGSSSLASMLASGLWPAPCNPPGGKTNDRGRSGTRTHPPLLCPRGIVVLCPTACGPQSNSQTILHARTRVGMCWGAHLFEFVCERFVRSGNHKASR